MLSTCFMMEQMLFCDYESRLEFDDTLMGMRAEFEHRKEKLRDDLDYSLQYDSAPCTYRVAVGRASCRFQNNPSRASLPRLPAHDKGPVLFREPGLHGFFVQHWGQLEGAEAARFSVK
jgi:hypothetical protein